MPEMISRASGPGEEKAAYQERYACDHTRMGVPILRRIVAIGAVDRIEDQDTSRGGYHTIREDGIAKIIMCPPDSEDLLIMKSQTIEINTVMPQLGNCTLHPLMVDSLHDELIPYRIGTYVRPSFFQYEYVCLRL